MSFRRDDHSGGEKQVQRSGEQEEQAGVEVQVQRCTRCRGTEVQSRCRGAEVQERYRGTEVQRCRCRGAGNVGAEV